MSSEMESKLQEEFRPYIKDYDDLEYFVKSKVAEQFILACDKYDLAVIGIEGFILRPDNMIEPQEDMIEDLWRYEESSG